MLSSWAAALKLSCSATARKVRSWCRVSPLSRASASALAATTIGHVTAEPAGGGRKLGVPAPAEARERVAALLDAGSFVELDRQRDPRDTAVVGFGTIDGREVVVYSCDTKGLGEVAA